MSVTVGEFLKTKTRNMARWIDEELYDGNDTLYTHTCNTPMYQLTAMAHLLQQMRHSISMRDWHALMCKSSQLPTWFQETLNDLRKTDAMHDKFWRYMDLFCDVISNEE